MSGLVHHMYMTKTVRPRFKKPALGRTFIRQWRQHRGLTVEQLADAIGITHASLSRIERQKQPYSQAILEAIADRLNADVASLLMRDPEAGSPMWSIWDQAKAAERKMIEDLARTVVKTGTAR